MKPSGFFDITNRIILISVLLSGLCIPSTLADDDAIKIDIEGEKAIVTVLMGKAYLVDEETNQEKPLKKGSFIYPDDMVRTDVKSRIEIKLPDNSFLRFDEKTKFKLESVSFDKKEKTRNINVKMILGKAWAKVYKLFGRKGRFALSTKTAVAGVRGTVFRMNVNTDDTVSIKVYWGEILVNKAMGDDSSTPTDDAGKPVPVSGPVPVAGPHPVSVEEWTYIVRSMQQIIINPDRTPTEPFHFTAKADLNDWVTWNQDLDKATGLENY